ncbi:gamma-glutamyltransferase [Tanticharoenia sakaeratensis]|uniref:gamma-glutamyltransferase n=1 Tax=Tanticharoenia sakaeratensis TaxID=444053 RepID=UPI00066277F5|nr:gamma-glutamyltransferase [Tanticharoenia sakaeratensis]GBQ17592.1 gamma-glutamyltranspeptidase [Tanticharoenia sakaeratensis NBRC 103193]
MAQTQRRHHSASRRGRRQGAAAAGLAIVASLSGCASVPTGIQTIGHDLFGHSTLALSGYVGTVVTDEPQAALTGREVLVRGGNAADAAAAVGLALSVTLPSRASLGGGGACIAAKPGEPAQSFLFLPVAGSAPNAGDRPAAVPMLARGLYLMQLRYGSVDFSDTVAPAESLARNGITVSRVFAGDLAAVQSALLADDNIRSTFTRADGSVVQSGDTLVQPRLAAFLSRLRAQGVGDLYDGPLAHLYAQAATASGGGLDASDLRRALPSQTSTLHVTEGSVTAEFVAPPADGGLGAASVFASHGARSADGVIAAWRAAHPESQSGAAAVNTDAAALTSAAQAALDSGAGGSGALPALPATTSYVVVDRSGEAVACALSDGNLFGTGRMAGSTGIVMGASPAHAPAPVLPAAILRRGRALSAVLAASGQGSAATALGHAAVSEASGDTPEHTGLGRVNSAICTGNEQCRGDTDPRGDGLATGDAH